MTEATIQKQIIELLERTGWFVLELRGNARRGGQVFQTKGTPDLYAAKRGRQIWLEVKRPDGKLMPQQEQVHSALRSNGVEVYVVRSLEDVQNVTGRGLR